MKQNKTVDAQESAIIMYAAKLGAAYTGEWEKRGAYTHLKLSKPGREDRWITFSNLELGNNPFNRLTIAEQEKKVVKYATDIGAVYTGEWQKGGSNNYFKLSKIGRDDRFINLGDLTRGRNPFTKLSLTEQEEEIVKHATDMGFTYTGEYKKGDKYNYFKLAKTGFEDRWSTTSQLKDGKNPFNQATIAEQEKEATMLAASMGATYTGEWEKQGAANCFKLAKTGFEDRWTILGSLRSGCDPFNQATLAEQEAEVVKYATDIGATYTGEWEKRGEYNHFKLSKPSRDDRWITPGSLRLGRDPFSRPTLAEQEKTANILAAGIEATYTGVHDIRFGINRFKLSRAGFEDRWMTLAHLRSGRDPFTAIGGFDTSKPAHNYVLLVTMRNGQQCVKTGIAGPLPVRLKKHGRELKTACATHELIHSEHSIDGALVLDRETYLKKLFKPYRTSIEATPGVELEGFTYHGGECFTLDIKERLVAELKRLVTT